MKSFLHVGCGPQNKSSLKGFNSVDWHEVRFDIDKSVMPDIEGTLTNMAAVASASFDAIYSSHNIEHLYPHEVPIALAEFHRVLKPNGIVVISCPDLISVCEAVVKDRLLEPLYVSGAGPISPIDILYGHRGYIAGGNEFMAHRGGFTYSTLRSSFFDAGFASAFGGSRPQNFDLWLIAFKEALPEDDLESVSLAYLP